MEIRFPDIQQEIPIESTFESSPLHQVSPQADRTWTTLTETSCNIAACVGGITLMGVFCGLSFLTGVVIEKGFRITAPLMTESERMAATIMGTVAIVTFCTATIFSCGFCCAQIADDYSRIRYRARRVLVEPL